MATNHYPGWTPPCDTGNGTDCQRPFIAAPILQISFSSLMGILSVILLVIFVKRSKETFFNWLYTNLISLSLVCTAIARPAAILSHLKLNVIHPSLCTTYCIIYTFTLELEAVGVPLAVLALIIERSVYFSALMSKSLTSYKQRLSCAWKTLLVALPWLGGILFACVRPMIQLWDVQPGRNDTQGCYSCLGETASKEVHYSEDTLWYTVRLGMPCVHLTAALMVMLVYWDKVGDIVNQDEDEIDCIMRGKCIKVRRMGRLMWRMIKSCFGTNRSENGSQRRSSGSGIGDSTDGIRNVQQMLEPTDKTNTTVLVVILLALTCAFAAVGSSVMPKSDGLLKERAQWLYFGLELVAVLLAYFFPDIRQTLGCCGHTHRRDEETQQKLIKHHGIAMGEEGRKPEGEEETCLRPSSNEIQQI